MLAFQSPRLGPLRAVKRRSGSKHGSVSSAGGERELGRAEVVAGHDTSNSDDEFADREDYRQARRPTGNGQRPQILQSIPLNPPPSPRQLHTRRPTGPIARPMSPVGPTYRPMSPPAVPSNLSRTQLTNEVLSDRYERRDYPPPPPPPPPPPQQPPPPPPQLPLWGSRPVFSPSYEDNTLSPPQRAGHHHRSPSGNDPAAERELQLQASEDRLAMISRQWQQASLKDAASRTPPRTLNSADRFPLNENEDDKVSVGNSRTDSWVVIPRDTPRAGAKDQPLSPPRRLPHMNSQLRMREYARFPTVTNHITRPTIPNHPRQPPPPPPTAPLDPRSATSPRGAAQAVPPNWPVAWKGADKPAAADAKVMSPSSPSWNRLNPKSLDKAKSMDNLRANFAHPANLRPGSRQVQLSVGSSISITAGAMAIGPSPGTQVPGEMRRDTSSSLPRPHEQPRVGSYEAGSLLSSRPLPSVNSSLGLSESTQYQANAPYGSRGLQGIPSTLR